ncbi:MBL fold metallo-hydrolase [Catenuloplanes indicus JCM 9534]|uniref:beta-lactamase n=1 Tax=Catenuloplanes indicus TaxID=137267 RepID=A0AAE3VY01_9ACTN|nr:glyoxylase-like metal-dependent hydrolase (beta-lactamase superfamily II) [Catenuloplanes indicus]
MREIVDGVFEVNIGFVHAHLVVTDDGVVLVDTGLPGRSGRVGAALRELRREIGDITAILVTHRHADHVGGLAALRRESGARVVAHERDAPSIDGTRPVPLTRLQRFISTVTGTAEVVPVDETLSADGAISVPGFSAVHTPGHTDGHVSYLLDRAGGVLFAGDAASGGRRGVQRSPKIMSDDPARAEESLRRLAALDFETVVFGHGTAVTAGAADRFRALIA